MFIRLTIDLQGQGHSDTIVNVEEFCFDALPPTYKQCDFAILEDEENFIRSRLRIGQQKSATVTQ